MASILATVASINDRHGNTSGPYRFNGANNTLYVTKEEVEDSSNKSKGYYLLNPDDYTDKQLVRLDDVEWSEPIDTSMMWAIGVEVLDHLDTNLPNKQSVYYRRVEYKSGQAGASEVDKNMVFSPNLGTIPWNKELGDVGGMDPLLHSTYINILTDLHCDPYDDSVDDCYVQYGLGSIKITITLKVTKTNRNTGDVIESFDSDPITTTLLGSSVDYNSIINKLDSESTGNAVNYQASWSWGPPYTYVKYNESNYIGISDDIFTMKLEAGVDRYYINTNGLSLKLADLELKYPTYDDGEFGWDSKNIEVYWKLNQVTG